MWSVTPKGGQLAAYQDQHPVLIFIRSGALVSNDLALAVAVGALASGSHHNARVP
jgi:hypothetical protein